MKKNLLKNFDLLQNPSAPRENTPRGHIVIAKHSLEQYLVKKNFEALRCVAQVRFQSNKNQGVENHKEFHKNT